MGTTKTAICNQALLLNGQKTIADIAENSTEAAYCRVFYENCKQRALKTVKPSFAKRTTETALAEVADVTSSQWAYVYSKPAGCLFVLELQPDESWVDQSQKIKFELVGDYIYTNEENPWCKYITDTDELDRADPLFESVAAHLLAIYTSMPIHRDPQWTGVLVNLYRDILKDARLEDGNEGHEVPVAGQTFISARK